MPSCRTAGRPALLVAPALFMAACLMPSLPPGPGGTTGGAGPTFWACAAAARARLHCPDSAACTYSSTPVRARSLQEHCLLTGRAASVGLYAGNLHVCLPFVLFRRLLAT